MWNIPVGQDILYQKNRLQTKNTDTQNSISHLQCVSPHNQQPNQLMDFLNPKFTHP